MKKGAHNDPDLIDYQWLFSKGKPDEIIEGILDKIRKNPDSLKAMIQLSGDAGLQALLEMGNKPLFEAFIKEDLNYILTTIIVNSKKI